MLGNLFVPLLSGPASQKTHQLDKAWIGAVAAMRRKRQFVLLGLGRALSFLSNNFFHDRPDPRKRTLGGRHQIGIPAGFKSESVAGFLLELVAGFVGIRTLPEDAREFVMSD